MGPFKFFFFGIILTLSFSSSPSQSTTWEYRDGDYKLTWNLDEDKARVVAITKSSTIWEGSLLCLA
jgi:hypothetical protein